MTQARTLIPFLLVSSYILKWCCRRADIGRLPHRSSNNLQIVPDNSEAGEDKHASHHPRVTGDAGTGNSILGKGTAVVLTNDGTLHPVAATAKWLHEHDREKKLISLLKDSIHLFDDQRLGHKTHHELKKDVAQYSHELEQEHPQLNVHTWEAVCIFMLHTALGSQGIFSQHGNHRLTSSIHMLKQSLEHPVWYDQEMGSLSCLPLELLKLIVAQLGKEDRKAFSQVSKNSRVVSENPDRKPVIGWALRTLQALHFSEMHIILSLMRFHNEHEYLGSKIIRSFNMIWEKSLKVKVKKREEDILKFLGLMDRYKYVGRFQWLLKTYVIQKQTETFAGCATSWVAVLKSIYSNIAAHAGFGAKHPVSSLSTTIYILLRR